MTHPLLMDLKSIGYEELEKRYSEILSRMQKLRAWGNSHSEMWDQFQMILDTIIMEKEERLYAQDTQKETASAVIVNSDPLEDEIDELSKKKRQGKQYTVL